MRRRYSGRVLRHVEIGPMSVHNLLEQLLRSGTRQFDSARQSGDLAKYGTGAAVGGALALLLGSKRGRSLGGKALKLGSIAAIGTLAWKVYQDWQSQQQQQQAKAPASVPGAPQRFESLPAPAIEDHSRAMLKAMIAAAKADGHMDDRERGLVEAELTRLDADPVTRQWMEAELRRPVEPAEVALAAKTPEMGAEIYLASVLVADETSTMERAYLDELAKDLKLAPELKADLEAKVRTA
jgi:uncharacterized membrane protein YebE (DUF533 family)